MISFKNTAYSKQLIYAKQLITISFSKSSYSKQLIYVKQLITTSFSKTAYSKHLIYAKQLITTIIQSKQPHTTRVVKTGYPARFGLAKRVTCFLGTG